MDAVCPSRVVRDTTPSCSPIDSIVSMFHPGPSTSRKKASWSNSVCVLTTIPAGPIAAASTVPSKAATDVMSGGRRMRTPDPGENGVQLMTSSSQMAMGSGKASTRR
jgi:hypothetical protein